MSRPNWAIERGKRETETVDSRYSNMMVVPLRNKVRHRSRSQTSCARYEKKQSDSLSETSSQLRTAHVHLELMPQY